MIDETRIEPALRQGPPFRTNYVYRALPLGSEVGPGGSRLLTMAAFVALAIVLAATIGGAALVGSGVIRLPAVPFLPEPASTPDQNAGPAWIATGDMVTPRGSGHTATRLDDGRVLVAGGADGSQLVVAVAELFDPSTLIWTPTGEMTHARTGHTATLLHDGRLLVAGGGDQWRNSGGTFRTAELYDPATGVWTATGSMTLPRNGHTATLLPDGTVLVAGGGAGNPSFDSVEIYDPAIGTWTSVQNLNQARGGHTATLLLDGRVLVVGGVVGGGGLFGGGGCCVPLSSAELFDAQTGSWTQTESMIDLRGGSNATLLLDGTVLVAGEINGDSVTTAEIYDPGAGSWSPTGRLIEPNLAATAMLLDGRVLAAGGAVEPEDFTGATAAVFTGLPTAQLYDPSTATWTRTSSMLAPRIGGHRAVTLADGRVLVVGGQVEDAYDPGRPERWSGVLSDPAAEVYEPHGED